MGQKKNGESARGTLSFISEIEEIGRNKWASLTPTCDNRDNNRIKIELIKENQVKPNAKFNHVYRISMVRLYSW